MRAGLALVLLLAGCREPAQPPLTAALLALSAEVQAAFALQLPARDETARELRATVAQARARLAISGKPPVDTLNALVFGERGFRREVVDTSPELMLLPHVLHQRRGSCLGLSALYLALGEALPLPLDGVLVPGHLFVRARGVIERDVELLRQGEQMPRRWYVEKYRVPPGNRLYLRALRPEETLAVYRYNLANELRLRGRRREALAQYRAVVAALPDHAEAQANLGLTHHLLKEYAPAEQAYRRAAAASPGLPGLKENLEALHRERRAVRGQ